MNATHDRRLTGYCNRCGGDCFDERIVGQDGVMKWRAVHLCPPKHPLVDEKVKLKFACDALLSIMDRRTWAKTITVEDCAELKLAVKAMLKALGRNADLDGEAA